ncbi:terpenoid synthase [Vararia minispora EC-137]|uniref:Terpenoid synthase n=1 Tax=Vararia minispora EC-137 TaxID=1314806 RepID=A0ACB8QQ08_9AGAM|nr:terpenoid synthase [Vararia minispora EC-137]
MSYIILPDTLYSWPWPRRINQHYSETKVKLDAWIHSTKILDAKAQNAFDKCDFVLLASLCYPHLHRDQLRVAGELMMLFFLFDECTDKVDGESVGPYINMVIDALEHPEVTPPEDCPCDLREITRQFWLRATSVAPLASRIRFKKTFIEYIKAVAFEAHDRLDNNIRSIDDYLQLRRLTAGGYPSLFPIDFAVDIPNEVMQHPTLSTLNGLVAESLILLNDVYSYNIEQASGHHAHNLVTVVMHELNVPIQDALEWIRRYHTECLERFLALKGTLPSWGVTVDQDVQRYVEGLAEGVRGIDTWCFESQRYFGPKGLQVQQTRIVPLLSRVSADVATPMTVSEVAAVAPHVAEADMAAKL